MSDTPTIEYGQSDAVAVAVAAALNAASDADSMCLKVVATRKFLRRTDFKDISVIGTPVTIEVIPGVELEDLVGLGGRFDDTYGCHVTILQNVADNTGTSGGLVEDQMALLLRLRSEIIELLCGGPLDCLAAVNPFAGAPVQAVRHGKEGLYDHGHLDNNVFYSELILTYKAAGLCRRNG